MQRVVSRPTALKFNQVLVAGVQPAISHQGWRVGLGFSGSFVHQPMDSFSVTSLTGNGARVLGSLPTHKGLGGSFNVNNSSVPRVRPEVTRSCRESRKLVTRRSRQRGSSSRIGSTGDFSPQRLLECAVDVLRNFNEKVNNLFIRGGDNEARDFTTALEEKLLRSADNSAVRENGAPELVGDDMVSEEHQPGFEWRAALWEAEISSVQKLEALSQRAEADVGIWADEKIEDNMADTIAVANSASPEPPSPENGNVISTVPVSDSESSGEVGDVSPVEEWTLDPRKAEADVEIWAFEKFEDGKADTMADTISAATSATPELSSAENGNVISTISVSDSESSGEKEAGDVSPVEESALDPKKAEAEVEIWADEKIEDTMTAAISASRELPSPENDNVSSTVTGSDSESFEEKEDAGVSSVEKTKLDPQSSQVSKLSGFAVPESAPGECDLEVWIDGKIEEKLTGSFKVEDLSARCDSSPDEGIGGMDDLHQEIIRLRNSISHHAYLYHTLDSPVISDAAYDSLLKELSNLETRVSNSESTPTFLVAAEPSPYMLKVIHSVPMLSLASVQREEEVLLWYQKIQQKLGLEHEVLGWVVEPKVDGLALSLRYENGSLTQAATRGNGLQGEDVTHNAQRVLGIPLTVTQKLHGTDSPLAVLEVRGEIFMSLKDFKEWNALKIQSGEKPMANPRNAAAGSMRLLSSNASDDRPLSFMAYSIAVIEGSKEPTQGNLERSSPVLKSQWAVLQFLLSAGFAVNDDNRLFETIDSALEYAKSWRSTRKGLHYEADGLVLKVNDLTTQASLGSTGADPRWALAWKFAATEAVSILEGIELTIGRSGAIIPNARFKPVEVGGVTISRASLHNFGHVKALGLCEGDHIVVQRAGDVIPQVLHVLEDLRSERAQPWLPPQECPACGSTLTEISASAMVFCSNSSCPSRHSRQVAHFARTLISGLGSANLGRLEEELVKDPADFYDLDEKALSNVKGFGKQSAKKLLKAIEDSKQQDVCLFIAALGIPRVGASTAKELAEKFGTLHALLQSDLSNLMEVAGIGAATAQCIFDWCQSEANIDLVLRLEAAGCKISGNEVVETLEKLDSKGNNLINEYEGESGAVGEDFELISQTNVSMGEPAVVECSDNIDETTESGGTYDDLSISDADIVEGSLQPTTLVLSGKSIVMTGDFGTVKREEMKKLVTFHGGVVRTSVTSRTSFVLCGNRPGPLKVAEASRRGIEMLDLHTFWELIGHMESDIV